MHCEEAKEQLGTYLDGELPSASCNDLEMHLADCPSCRTELAAYRHFEAQLADARETPPPESLWLAIERRLHEKPLPAGVPNAPGSSPRPIRTWRARRVPLALAASIVFATGLGISGLFRAGSTAKATTVDFSELLNALPLDARGAFRDFLVRYDAQSTTPEAARRYAPALNFDTPEVLPGGFRLQSVYQIRIGGAKGVAAAYDRDGEFLAVVFHPPMKHEGFGSHKKFPCVIGEHCGHKVQVGEWKLVHLTDPTTCHCLLSRLDEQGEMPAVMKAIAPHLPTGASGHDH